MDKLQAMSVFVQIAERGSLTAAAEALGKSLPSVVRTLAALEGSLGARLLNRTTRRIALTEEGRIYLERCRRILSEIEEAELARARSIIEETYRMRGPRLSTPGTEGWRSSKSPRTILVGSHTPARRWPGTAADIPQTNKWR